MICRHSAFWKDPIVNVKEGIVSSKHVYTCLLNNLDKYFGEKKQSEKEREVTNLALNLSWCYPVKLL
jgi:hypothetical protein